MGVPLFFIGIGDDHEVRDLKLHDLRADDSVYVNDRLVFEANLTAQGYSDQRAVKVTLFAKDRQGRFQALDSTLVKTDPEGTPRLQLGSSPYSLTAARALDSDKVGGLTPACTELGCKLFGSFISQVRPVSSPDVAELSKLTSKR